MNLAHSRRLLSLRRRFAMPAFLIAVPLAVCALLAVLSRIEL